MLILLLLLQILFLCMIKVGKKYDEDLEEYLKTKGDKVH